MTTGLIDSIIAAATDRWVNTPDWAADPKDEQLAHIVVKALVQVCEENAKLREALTDIAEHGCRHDLAPTHVRLGEGPSGGWERYVASMDATVRQRARRALR